jgi:hypothetical protein
MAGQTMRIFFPVDQSQVKMTGEAKHTSPFGPRSILDLNTGAYLANFSSTKAGNYEIAIQQVDFC